MVMFNGIQIYEADFFGVKRRSVDLKVTTAFASQVGRTARLEAVEVPPSMMGSWAVVLAGARHQKDGIVPGRWIIGPLSKSIPVHVSGALVMWASVVDDVESDLGRRPANLRGLGYAALVGCGDIRYRFIRGTSRRRSSNEKTWRVV